MAQTTKCPVCGKDSTTHIDHIDNVPVCDDCGEQTADPAEPQSCYPEEIEALREMLEEEAERATVTDGHISKYGLDPDSFRREQEHGRRIEALKTAIEALGGAL